MQGIHVSSVSCAHINEKEHWVKYIWCSSDVTEKLYVITSKRSVNHTHPTTEHRVITQSLLTFVGLQT